MQHAHCCSRVSVNVPCSSANKRYRARLESLQMIRGEITEKTDGLRLGSGCHGGLTGLPCGPMRGTRDNCSYRTTTIFVALIGKYTLMHSVVSRLSFAFSLILLQSPAVRKVGKPRWGHPLVEFVIVGKIRRKDWSRLTGWKTRACSCIHTRIKG